MNEVIHVDGPPMAYFEDESGRHMYRYLGMTGSDTMAIAKWITDTIRRINGAAGRLLDSDDTSVVVVWRSRPSIRATYKDDGIWTGSLVARMRLTTIPELSDEEWRCLVGNHGWMDRPITNPSFANNNGVEDA